MVSYPFAIATSIAGHMVVIDNLLYPLCLSIHIFTPASISFFAAAFQFVGLK